MFNACLINDSSSDPGVYVKFKYKSEAALFDLGEIYRLQPRQILKVKHVFISHTHMDHFIGFDHLLRICLGRDMHISLFGPPGFIKNVEGKLAA
jgi:ribonuclease Z